MLTHSANAKGSRLMSWTHPRVHNHCSLQRESTMEQVSLVAVAWVELVGLASAVPVVGQSLEELVDRFSLEAAVLSPMLPAELVGLALPHLHRNLAFFATPTFAFLTAPLDSHHRLCHQSPATLVQVDRQQPS